MDLDTYAEQARQTAVYPNAGTGATDALAYATLGLAGEAGELANKVKKILRGDPRGWDTREAMISELGDVLWYVAALAGELGISLDDVATLNLAKLADRASSGTIKGDGDNR